MIDIHELLEDVKSCVRSFRVHTTISHVPIVASSKNNLPAISDYHAYLDRLQRTFQFLFANTLLHEVGGHIFTTLMSRGHPALKISLSSQNVPKEFITHTAVKIDCLTSRPSTGAITRARSCQALSR